MSKKASAFQVEFMAWKYRGKEVFKPLNTGVIDERVKCLREYIANIFSIPRTARPLMTVGFILMSKAPVGRIVLSVVWVCHLAYFLLIVKTIRNEGSLELQNKGGKTL